MSVTRYYRHNPSSKKNSDNLEVTEWTLIAVAAALIAARLNLRVRIQKRRLLASDILMCAAWLSAVATAGFNIRLAAFGSLDPFVNHKLGNYERSNKELSTVLKVRLTIYASMLIAILKTNC